MQEAQLAASRVIARVLGGRNLERVLEEARLESDQRAAVLDLSYGTLRHLGRIDAILGHLLDRPLKDEGVRSLLRVALFQLDSGRSSQHAVVDQAVCAARKIKPAAASLVNAVLRNFLRRHVALAEEAGRSDSGRYSHAQWWVDALRAQYGERAEAILQAGNQHPPMGLRVNGRRGSVAEYQARLAELEIAARPLGASGLLLEKPQPVSKLPGFFDGLVSVQDIGAQYAATLLDVQAGQRVLDACAAPGGKTAHLLELADVDLTAVDKDAARLQRVRENLDRLGLQAELRTGDAGDPEAWWDGKPYQRILADVPCSASGVARRHPDIKWLRRAEDIAGFAAQQSRILAALWRLLASDGKLLYATCSVFEQENRQVIDGFLRQHADARLLPLPANFHGDGQLLPDHEHDGFFYALLQKV
jgi:16S rRNA (cytosine967-C5)-methyltransferase